MNHYDGLQLLALRAVMKPDGEARLRGICRWYSKTYNTPLHMVEDLPEDEVLTAYFETIYEEMDDEDRTRILEQLLETDEQKRERQRAKDAEEAEAFEFSRRLAAEEKQRQAKEKIADVQVEKKKPSMLSAADRRPAALTHEPRKPAFEKLEPDVNVKFVGAEDFEKELEGFGEMTPKKVK